jgi:hypothetical protein
VVEGGLSRNRGQFTVEQEVAGFEEVAVLGELLDGVAAVEKDALVAVDVGNARFAGGGGCEAGILGEHPGLSVELTDVQGAGADGAVLDRQLDLLVVDV